jgi:uncharacterized protein YegL
MLNRSDVALASVLIAWVLCLFESPSLTASDHVVIVLDDSGSMNEGMQGTRVRKMEAAKRALAKVIQQISENTNVGVLLLNGARSSNHWLVELGPLNRQNAIARVNSIQANGGTPLGEAMRIAADELLRVRGKMVYGTYRLIIVTDGEATDRASLDRYLPDILSRGLIVDAIGVNMQSDHSLATQVHSYRRADDEAALSNAIVEILAENSDRDAGASDADFELLNALNEVNAGEILKALATPNNDEVTGFLQTNPYPRNPYPSTGGTLGAAPTIPPKMPNNTNSPNNNNSGESGFITQVFGTFCTCMLPILIAIMIFITIVSRGNRKRRD